VPKQANRISAFGPAYQSRVPAGTQAWIGSSSAEHGHMKPVFRQTGNDFLYRQVLGIGVASTGIRWRKDGDGTRLGASHHGLEHSLNAFSFRV